MATGGITAAELLPALLTAGGNIGASALAPDPYQKRQSFGGLPMAAAQDAYSNTGDLVSALKEKLSQPVTLPHATVQGVAGFADPGPLSHPASLPGLQFGATRAGLVDGGSTPTRQPFNSEPDPFSENGNGTTPVLNAGRVSAGGGGGDPTSAALKLLRHAATSMQTGA